MESVTEAGEVKDMATEGGQMKATPEGGETKRMPSRSFSRQASSRQFQRSKSILESGSYSRSSSILKSDEVAIETPEPVEEPLVVGFEALRPLDVKPEDPLPADPAGALHGVLENGMRYYVRKNAKPRNRAALGLAVSVGSVFEEDGEQGVAHIVEHLAFSATKDYSDHDLVHFLESIGSKFGPCNNAYTSLEETVYEILVPVDRPEILSKALHILAEFSTEIRASDEDLEKERGAVLEEWRLANNFRGRENKANWKFLMEGSKYADRLPIGEEEVIKSVPGQRVRDFFHTWYRPENMAVVAVGDFSDLEDVVKLINLRFAAKQGHDQGTNRPLTIPRFPVPSHNEPRFLCYQDPEASVSMVTITCKAPRTIARTVQDYREELARWMLLLALDSRLFRVSKQPDAPFFSGVSNTEVLAISTMCNSLEADCCEGGTLQALEQLLTEVARIRLHGFSEREIAVARAETMASLKTTYLQRDQIPSTEWRGNYVEHFLTGSAMPSIEYSSQLRKTLLEDITAEEVQKVAEHFNTTCSCTIKTTEPHAIANVEALKAVVAKVAEMERQGDIATWEEENIPDVLVKELPTPGVITGTNEFPEFDAKEIILSNGMRVCYKCTDFNDDEILIRGFAYGGISEVDEKDHYTCKMGRPIAREIGEYGHKPTVLAELMAGKYVFGSTTLGYYSRTFEADCAKADLEAALQLGHQLFVTEVDPTEAEVKLVMQIYLESIKALQRDPQTRFDDRKRAVNFGDAIFYRGWTPEGLSEVDPKKACQYFSECYKDPSTFTVMLVGAIDTEVALPLILQYLGGIPKPEKPVMHYNPENLSVVPVTPSPQIIREEVRMDMVDARCEVCLTFPIHLDGPDVGTDMEKTDYMCKFLQQKILEVLRFKHGKVLDHRVPSERIY
ncbi:hypothetical protein KC19_10G125800 [Ceratodon purpureus]|uniref:Uncharacterized protein n=1 Tax=Ceratodon purpureus TaxID=3225 RepID=A0A8T0GPU3_CERPU|nr:hypothetical protein KC19_10G125800 [Ceratodon purpureus]KAG0559728.1 hypothetical protein KC19_10G125800 [Ceratodon purpureus]KAG0559737.1 hypothetical protein KC19_10G125800 [Ceratodon purpureus]